MDVKEEYNSTTLGPFSFQAFVQASWTEAKLKLKSKFEANHKALVGRRRKLIVGKGCRKRPRALEVLQTSLKERLRKKAKRGKAIRAKEIFHYKNGRLNK